MFAHMGTQAQLRVIGAMRSALADNSDPKAAALRAELDDASTVSLRTVQEVSGLSGVPAETFFKGGAE